MTISRSNSIKKRRRRSKKSRSPASGAEVLGKRPTIISGLVFFMICFIPILACLIFGAVSTGTLALLTLAISLLVIFWVADIWRSKMFRINLSPLLIPIIALIFIGFIQLLPLGSYNFSHDVLSVSPVSALSFDPNSTKLAIAKLLMFLVFFAAALSYINNPQRLRKSVFTVVIFCAAMAFIGILQYLASPDFIYGMREIDYAKPFGSYVNRHHFAALMEMSIGLTLGLLFGKATENDKRPLLIIAVVLMGIAIVLTGSRGGFLSLMGVLGMLVFLNIFYKDTSEEEASESKGFLRDNLILIGGSAVLVIALLASAIWLGGSEQIIRGAAMQVNDPDFTTGRVHFWSTTLQIIRDNFLIGTGLDSFGIAYTKYDTWNGSLRLEQAHNEYLQILSDGGILGFLCFVGFIFLFFRRSLTVIKNTRNLFRKNVAVGALAGCFGIMLHSFVDFPLRTNANMFFFLTLVALATVAIRYPKVLRKPNRVRQPNALRAY